MSKQLESPEAIGVVDAIFAVAGILPGKRATREGSWSGGERVKVARVSPSKAAVRKGRPGVVKGEKLHDVRGVLHGFSGRSGGVSGVYGDHELNLGWTSSDPAEATRKNRKLFVGEVAGKAKVELVTVRQTHSGIIWIVEKDHGPLVTPEGKAVLRGDGLMTDVPGLLLGVQTADCVPVLIADRKTGAVAAFHAGWRGTLKRIVERGVGTMQLRYGSKPKDLVAAIGPSIGACCFAVGEEVKFEFSSQFAYAPELFSEVFDSDPIRDKYPLLFLTARAPGHSPIGPQIHLDLWEANRRQLLDAGLLEKNIEVVGECTGCTRLKDDRRKYFSHRMEHGFTGRMLSVIGRSESAG
jgi:YfiH family protein